jgi:hypothetical protein
MEHDHDLLELLHLPPQDRLVVNSGFVGVPGEGVAVHVPCSEDAGFAMPTTALAGHDDCGWMEDLMHLGDELFAGDDNNVAGTGDHQTSMCGGGPPEGPPPSVSLDRDGSLPSAEKDDVSEATRRQRDRSKTIVSERTRRGRMKEKLYELRALVPNITKVRALCSCSAAAIKELVFKKRKLEIHAKLLCSRADHLQLIRSPVQMDKASIIADAVVYVRNLQSHARKLKDEVATLEAAAPRSPAVRQQQQQHRLSGAADRRQQNRVSTPLADDDEDVESTGAVGARVTHVGATQVGDGRFFVTVECEWRDGVTAPLCSAVESLVCFRVDSSSLGRSGPDRVVSTHILKVHHTLEKILSFSSAPSN